MEDIKFNSLDELYIRLYPALNTKKNEFKLNGINIEEIDIWNYLRIYKWDEGYNLFLYDMVDDIMNIKKIDLINYFRNKRSEKL